MLVSVIDWIFAPLQNFYAEVPNPNATVLEDEVFGGKKKDEAFERCLDSKGTTLVNGISVFIKQTSREPSPYPRPPTTYPSLVMTQ